MNTTSPPDGQSPHPHAGFKKGPIRVMTYPALLALARAALIVERLLPRLWPAAGLFSLFVSLALLDVLPLLPFWLHGIFLAAFIGAISAALVWGVRGVAWPSTSDARARLERDSGLTHQPLAALDDRLALGQDDRVSRRLWKHHMARVAGALARLKLRRPAPDFAAFDPWSFRAPVLLILIIGIAAGTDAPFERLKRALTPTPPALALGPTEFTIWITPPAYTGAAPIVLSRVSGAETPEGQVTKTDQEPNDQEPNDQEMGSVKISVPEGSSLIAQVTGASGTPILTLGAVEAPLERVSGLDQRADAGSRAEGGVRDGHQTDLVIDGGGEQRLTLAASGQTLGSWDLEVVADRVPMVGFTARPSRTGRASLKTAYEAEDDYGLQSVTLVLRHPKGLAVPGGDTTVRLRLPLRTPGASEAEGTGVHDLGAHPWAGIEVLGTLEGTDGKGQVGRSEDLPFVLPQRTFNHPVARALVDQRRALSNAAPGDQSALRDVAQVLADLGAKPKHFFDDTVVYLSISMAQHRLRYAGLGGVDRMGTVAEVQKLLWETALRIEDGDFSVAERELLDAQQRLQEALEDGDAPEEIARILQEVERALEQYLSALTEQLRRENLSEIPTFDQNLQTLETSDLQRILEEARELAEAGALDAARQLLSQLQQAVEAIRNGLAMAPQQQQELQEAQQLMQGLRELADRQRRLLDETFDEAQRQRGLRFGNRGGSGAPSDEGFGQSRPDHGGEPGQRSGREPGQGPGEGFGNRPGGEGQAQSQAQGQQGQGLARPPVSPARRQDALRRGLGELMLQMGEIMGSIPAPFGEAERAMKQAGDALRGGRPSDAVPAQSEALEKLQQAQNQAAQQLAQQFGGGLQLGQGSRGQRGQGRDPFGRGQGDTFGRALDGDTKVPSRMERRRAHEILRELRKRSGEWDRPAGERDYIDRLLKQF